MKKWLEPLAGAWTGVVTHKLRSSLTVLGVVIGVAAVITLMSIGKGTSANILSRVESLGSNLLFVQPGSTVQGGVRSAAGSATTLTLEDATAISQQVKNVATVAPYCQTALQVISSSQNTRTRITGITPDYQQAYNLQLSSGNLISQYQCDNSMKVAVLGSTVKTTLFGTADAVGESIRVGNMVMHVIGVLQSKGSSMMGSPDDSILTPLTALQEMVAQQRTSRGETIVSSIVISASDKDQAKSVTNDITALLRKRHALALSADNDFTVTSVEDLATTISAAAISMTMLLGESAAISLLVGGICVLNIMLVSVIERTREIGIRKALGAKERDIWGQFLIEAAMLTLSGGVIGVAIGWAASIIASRVGSMTTVVSADIVILALSVSLAIGLFFGFYPARHASRLDPIQCLRAD